MFSISKTAEMKAEGFEEYRRFEVNGEIVGRRRMEGWVSAREVMWGKIHSHGEWKTKNDTSFFLGFEFEELRFWHCVSLLSLKHSLLNQVCLFFFSVSITPGLCLHGLIFRIWLGSSPTPINQKQKREYQCVLRNIIHIFSSFFF